MANVLGKRYMCEKCGTEVLCNKAGPGSGLECCDVEMKIKGSETATVVGLEIEKRSVRKSKTAAASSAGGEGKK